jgi:Fe-S-cluster containining protein
MMPSDPPPPALLTPQDEGIPPAEETRTATVGMNISGRSVQAEITVPAGPTALRQLVPLFNSLTDLAVQIAVEDAERNGAAVSCRKGCGACCRQLVPVSYLEARWIADYVKGLPEPRRSTIRARFKEALQKAEDAGMLEKLCEPQAFDVEEVIPFGLSYFGLGIPCPFLEEESCSIHPDRPLICREFLVTSPAENCAQPLAETTERMEVPGRLSTIVAQLEEETPGPMRPWVPLILALAWDETHPDPTPLRPGPEWVEEFFARIALSQQA